MDRITVDLWGPYACFTPPYAKVDRVSSDVPTPSALRGLLDSIYCKPSEFYWTINRIEVMNPIKHITCKQNEVTFKISGRQPINIDQGKNMTQRTTVMLKDVRYRVTATINPYRPEKNFAKGLYAQAVRRIETGQCFRQPYFGMREFECYFELSDMKGDPIPVTRDFNLMTFDTHIPYDNTRGSSEIHTSLYHCVMRDGIIDVPDYDSPEVLKMPTNNLILGGTHHV